MASEPKYLVQSQEGCLHGYNDDTILRIDLRENKTEEVKLFKLVKGWTIKYAPMTREEIMTARQR